MKVLTKERNLGQFFTTNSDYILQGFGKFIKNKEVADPFAGNQDLLNWAKKTNAKKLQVLIMTKNILTIKMFF